MAISWAKLLRPCVTASTAGFMLTELSTTQMMSTGSLSTSAVCVEVAQPESGLKPEPAEPTSREASARLPPLPPLPAAALPPAPPSPEASALALPPAPPDGTNGEPPVLPAAHPPAIATAVNAGSSNARAPILQE